MTKILLVGPSYDINSFEKEYFVDKKNEGFISVSFSNSLSRFLDLNISPDYWSFFDPFTTRLYLDVFNQNKLKETTLLTLDLYDNNLSKMTAAGYPMNNMKRNPNLLSRFYALNFSNIFKEHIKVNYQLETVDNISSNKLLFDPIFRLLKPNGKDQCKFATFIVPLLFKHFKNISDLTIIGFGHLNQGRYIGANNKAGNTGYRVSFNMFKDQIKEFLSNNNINVSFEGQQSEFNVITPHYG